MHHGHPLSPYIPVNVELVNIRTILRAESRQSIEVVRHYFCQQPVSFSNRGIRFFHRHFVYGYDSPLSPLK